MKNQEFSKYQITGYFVVVMPRCGCRRASSVMVQRVFDEPKESLPRSGWF